MACARILLAQPRFAFLDRPVTVLGVEGVDRVLHALRAHSITYLTICETHDLKHHHDAVLEVTTDGTWRWTT